MDNEATPEGVTAEDLRLYKWQDVISKHPRKQSHSYAGPLLAEAERLKQQGDPRGFRTFAFLAKVASLHADYSNRGNPYEPSWRGPIDLCASGLDALENMIGEIQDSEFKARVGAILWEFAADTKPQKWPWCLSLNQHIGWRMWNTGLCSRNGLSGHLRYPQSLDEKSRYM